MIRFLVCVCIVFSVCVDVSAIEIDVPRVPYSAEEYMPDNTETFSESLFDIVKNVLNKLIPVYKDAAESLILLIVIIMVLSIVQIILEKECSVTDIVGCCAISYILLATSNTMIHLATETIRQISDYGMLLIPVLTATLAAQGGISSSTALYAGTAIFNQLISGAISSVLIPVVYVFLALSIVSNATGEGIIKRISTQIKRFVCWALKFFVTIFTTYMSVTGVVSGTADVVALKATKNVISTTVPEL